ncbi:MAG: septum formation inhibitor Maf [Methylococcaceae bacterium]|nr:septum formation inhibitor Maf [Methylococcaceae bacterium]
MSADQNNPITVPQVTPPDDFNRKLVLATGSRYRRQLLGKLELPFDSASPDIDESHRPGESPMALARRLASEKAMALANQFPDHLIIGSDQVAELNGRALGKPGTHSRATAQLRAASGNTMVFFTAVCVLDSRSTLSRSDVDRTVVYFRPLTDQQIERYVDREQPLDCAGSFKSEGLGIALFEKIDGEDPNALIGLPLIRLIRILEAFGCRVL